MSRSSDAVCTQISNLPSMAGRRRQWILFFATLMVCAGTVILPVWLIQPFREQTPTAVALSYILRRYGSIVCAIATGIAVLLFVQLWPRSKRLGRIIAVVFLPLFAVSLWFSFQNHFEWMFHPLRNSSYAPASTVNFVEDSDMVLAVRINGEAVAYPVRLLAYHHLVQDTVGGVPIVATY